MRQHPDSTLSAPITHHPSPTGALHTHVVPGSLLGSGLGRGKEARVQGAGGGANHSANVLMQRILVLLQEVGHVVGHLRGGRGQQKPTSTNGRRVVMESPPRSTLLRVQVGAQCEESSPVPCRRSGAPRSTDGRPCPWGWARTGSGAAGLNRKQSKQRGT